MQKLPAALSFNLHKFFTVHGLYASVLGLTEFYMSVGAVFLRNASKEAKNKAQTFRETLNW